MISYGSQRRSAEMPCDNRSHQLGKGQAVDALMPKGSRPSRPVYGSQQDCTPMSPCDRSHQLGKGQGEYTGMSVVVHPSRQLGEGHDTFAEMPYNKRPSQPVYGSRNHNAAMPMEKRSHLFTRGQSRYAAMPRSDRLSRGGSVNKHKNVRRSTPFPTSYRGSVLDRRNAKDDAPPPNLGHLNYATMLISKRPILTRGQTEFAEMPFIERLATKEIQYGYKI